MSVEERQGETHYVATGEPNPRGQLHIPGIKPPAPLKLGASARDDWNRWKEEWEDYSVIQDLPSKPADVQLAVFRVALYRS